MTATAQFSRPIIVGIVYLAAIVRFLTSLARRKETKPALNQHGSYRKLLVKRRLVKVMPDILIRGISLDDCFGKTIEIGRDADGHVFVYVDNGETAVLDVAELPPHGDLIDRDAIKYVTLYGAVLGTTEPIINEQPVIVPAERREGDAPD